MGREVQKQVKDWNKVDEGFKIHLLESIGDESSIRDVLEWVMERAEAEFCAMYARKDVDYLYVLLDSRELHPKVQEIRSKLSRSFMMFSNDSSDYGRVVEKVFYKRDNENISYLFGSTRIESYFLTPVVFDSRMQGVLFVGSVKKEAFTKRTIAEFATLAEEGIKGVRLMVGSGEEQLLSSLVNAFPFGAALIASDGKIIIANDGFKRVIGLERDVEFIEEIPDVSPFNLQTVWNEHVVLRRKIVGRKLKGMCVPDKFIDVSISTMTNISMGSSSLMIVNDITEIMDTYEDRNELIACVAHELRTPLAALKNSLSLMKSAVEGEDFNVEGRNRLARFISTAVRTVDRLGRLADGLIDSSFMEDSDDDLDIRRVDLESFIDDALSVFRESIRKKEIELTVDISTGVETAFLDTDRMEQIIQNLISNSLKNTTSGGSIKLEVALAKGQDVGVFSEIPPELQGHVKFIVLTVSDSGSGVPEEISSRVNSPGDDIRPRVRSSHGLGLHIARKLAYKHAGLLRVERGKGTGTIARVFVPFDYDTREIVKNIRFIKKVVNSKADGGSAFVIYVLVKETSRCWLEIAGNWNHVPVVNPVMDEFLEGGFFLWPIGDRYAIAVATKEEILSSPISIFPHSRGKMRVLEGSAGDFVKAGWAVCPIDGVRFSKLIEVSREKLMEIEVPV